MHAHTLQGQFVALSGNQRLHCFNFVAIFGIELSIGSTHHCTFQRIHIKSFLLALSVLLSIVTVC